MNKCLYINLFPLEDVHSVICSKSRRTPKFARVRFHVGRIGTSSRERVWVIHSSELWRFLNVVGETEQYGDRE